MPARKAASKKRKKVTVSRKKIAARKTVAKKSASRTRKKVAKKKVSKKSLSKGRKKAAPKRKVSKKKAISRKKPASKKKATSRKKPAVRKKAAAKKKVAKKKVAKKASARRKPAVRKKSAAKKKATSKKKPAIKKKAAAKKKVAKKANSQKRPVVRTRPAPKKKPPLRRVRSAGNALSGPIHGIKPYKARSGEEYMSDKQFEHFRDILGAWKTELMFEVDRTVHHMQDEAANFPDPNDRATQESEFGLELRTRDRERKLLRKIDSALIRIDDGSYGFCEETGEEIGLKRLEARPVATLSLEAQERREMAERQFRDRDDRYR